ncbi:unnamed protein product [Mytilus edulis]|uniref:Uncharacterized protein n=1 Tax=Mytilus edulis TaxID=6550 RepID=A0A8S3QYZ8_MYTED|nr:unnamed protein product [Mytilus edulis]
MCKRSEGLNQLGDMKFHQKECLVATDWKVAKNIRLDIRNPWAHCDFTEWTTTKYADSFQLMGQFITNLRLSNREEKRILGELNRWATNGQNFLSGTKLDVEILDEFRQQTHILSEYAQRVCTETDGQFTTFKKKLTNLESVSNIKKIIQLLSLLKGSWK